MIDKLFTCEGIILTIFHSSLLPIFLIFYSDMFYLISYLYDLGCNSFCKKEMAN